MLKLPSAGLQSIGAIATTETMPIDLGTSSRRRQALNWLPAQWPHPRLIAYAALMIALLLVFAKLHQQPFDVNIIRFLVADATGIALALMIGFVGLAYYLSFNTRSLLFISIGFIGSGIIDLVHLVQTLNTNQSMFPELFFQVREWSTLAAHLFLAILLLVGWRAAEGRISPRSTSELGAKGVISFSALLLILLLGASFVLPSIFSLNHEVLALRSLELAVGLLYMGALAIFLRGGDWRFYPFQHWFVIALILLTFSQALFTPLALHAGDSVDVTAHGLRLAGYAMAFVALLSSTQNLFRQASSVQLEERINSLIREHGRTHSPGFVSTIQDQRITGSGTFELDLQTGRFKANRVVVDLLGGADGAAAANTLEQFVEILHPEDRAKMIAALRRSQVDGELFKQQFRVASSGGYRWMESIGGIEYVNGKPIRLLGFTNDVTERKNIELEKDRLYLELDQTIAALDQYAITATLDLEGSILAANGLFCDFCGLEEEELIGQKFDSLLMQDLTERPGGKIRQTMRDGKTWNGYVSLRDSRSAERTANVSLSPHLNNESEIDTYIFLGLDITARVAARRALEVSIEEHKKSNEELQMFAHIVSHDLQEPMRMVSSFMTLLERRHAADLNPEAREYIQFAVEGATRMRSLLDGLLEYSRVRSRDMVFEQIRLNKPVADAMANLALVISEREAQITVAALPEIRGDSVQLMQLFQNLISNGIKFCSAHPPKIAIGAHRDEGRWVVEVSDNGIGIDPAHYQKIFQIFSRLHSREAYPGTGVGLAVCKQIMERLGGHIEVESMPGQGTTFKLCF